MPPKTPPDAAPFAARRRSAGPALVAALIASAALASGRVSAEEALVRACGAKPAAIAVPGTGTCLAVRPDVRTVVRYRSGERRLLIERSRSRKVPAADYRLRAPSAAERGTRRVEAKLTVESATETEHGKIETSVGTKLRHDAPIDRPGEWRAVIDSAFLTFRGVTAGHAPSAFDFTPGLNYTTAYASERSLTRLSYGWRPLAQTELVASLEDGTERRVQARAFGRYEAGTPDLVLAVRRTGDAGELHGAFALHPIEASARCCGSADPAAGWAATAGVDHSFELFGRSGHLLVSAAAASGALDYLNIPQTATDLVVGRSGRVTPTTGQALVISYEHSWTKRVRSIHSASLYATATEAALGWRSRGALLQAGLEYVPVKGFQIGVELNRYLDEVRADRRSPVLAGVTEGVFYVRRRL